MVLCLYPGGRRTLRADLSRRLGLAMSLTHPPKREIFLSPGERTKQFHPYPHGNTRSGALGRHRRPQWCFSILGDCPPRGGVVLCFYPGGRRTLRADLSRRLGRPVG